MRAKRARQLRDEAGWYRGDQKGKNAAFRNYKELKRQFHRFGITELAKMLRRNLK